MADHPTPTPVIRLARGRRRLLAAPTLLVLAAAAAVGGGIVIAGPAGIALAAAGGLSALLALYLLVLVSSYRVEVEPGGLVLRWFGGARSFRLVRGAVTRVAVSGPAATALHPRFGVLGWSVGPATLRGEEPIELIRLATRVPLILVPTDRGRLAIAPQVESDLLAALAVAVRLQERIDELVSRRAAPQVEPTQAEEAGPAPRVLTGIERAMLEQRLAAERAAAMAAGGEAPAPAPVAAVEAAPEARPVAPVTAPPAAVAAPPARARTRTQWRRPDWLAVPAPATVVAALPIAVPLIGAAIAWIALAVTGRPELPVAEARLLIAALVLVGPVGALAALVARTWYPRLGGVVAASSLAALAMLARTVLS